MTPLIAFLMKSNVEIAREIIRLFQSPAIGGFWRKKFKPQKSAKTSHLPKLESSESTERTPKPGVVYSSAVKQNNKPINQPAVTDCAHCGYRSNTDNLRKTSLQPVASMKSIFSANSLPTPRELSTSLQTASIVSPLMVRSPPKQKQSINAAKSNNITNVNRPEQIKETKAAKKARLTALKKKKNLRNNPTSKEDF
ncbi:hypothetical protein AVEN_159173-1 [Araneus ventricosus]|uniref:Uncharacterized protein n=1 Tax=Araneus ventricosus TaxID=182803 RepID=A0A4Y2UWD4_ARAVE|nr:hypothetical protein AVEN_159173-1 [Araneus ventricosus]